MLYYIIEAVFLAMFVEIFGAFWTNFIFHNQKKVRLLNIINFFVGAAGCLGDDWEF